MKRTDYIVIPAYQPDIILVDIVDRITSTTNFSVVVVNDGSDKSCDSIFNAIECKCKVLSHSSNQGKGEALKTAFKYLLNIANDDSVIALMDADGQHKLSDVCNLIKEVKSGDNGLYLGSREFTGKVPLHNKLGNKITMGLFRLITNIDISDTQTGLRAFRGKLLDELIKIDGSRYEYEMNMLLKFAEKKIPIREMTIETVYIDGNKSSHFNPLLDSIRIYREILKFLASSVTGFVVDYLIYALLIFMGFGLTVSNVFARFVSATVNFLLNRNFVFKSKNSFFKSLIKYTALAVFILISDTALLMLFTNILGINYFAAKLIVEPIMFVFNWTIQKLFVFGKTIKPIKPTKIRRSR